MLRTKIRTVGASASVTVPDNPRRHAITFVPPLQNSYDATISSPASISIMRGIGAGSEQMGIVQAGSPWLTLDTHNFGDDIVDSFTVTNNSAFVEGFIIEVYGE
jgi:hypothetical protein